VLIFSVLLLSASCERPHAPPLGGGTIPKNEAVNNKFTPNEDKIAIFENGYVEGFWARNDRGNGHPFNCSFSNRNAIIANGLLTLTLNATDNGYAGAEYRSGARFSYGYYSVSMKAAKCPGVISSFFTYTGWPWDEIDIEFLGDDTTRVQFNYYTNGKGGHEYVYELGFDASKEFHEYGFDWQPDSITWYVDGVSVYKATVDIPSHAGHIMMNLWNVADSNSGWAGKFDESKLPLRAEYEWIGYKSADDAQLYK
jgi:endoglucanase